MRSFVVETDRLDVAAAARLVAAQQVRGHLLNPFTNARADVEAIEKRVERSAERAERIVSVFDASNELKAFCVLEGHTLDPLDVNGFFSGATGMHSTEFAVPNVEDPDADGIACALAESIYGQAASVICVEVPIGSAWCEHLLLRAGFRSSGVESIRRPYNIHRVSRGIDEGIRLREATETDIEPILDLMLEEWNYLTSFHCLAGPAWIAADGRQALRQHLIANINPLMIVAESKDGILGVVHLRRCEIVDSTNPLPYGTHVMIEDISVQAGLRGQGIGRALVQATYDAFRDENIGGYGVSYVADNPIARRLWPHLGFRAHKRSYVRKT